MSQDAIAGLGNVHVDEILFNAGLHPDSSSEKLDAGEVAGLFGSIQDVSERAIDARANVADMPDDWLLPRREEGSSCPRDGGTIEKMEVSVPACPRTGSHLVLVGRGRWGDPRWSDPQRRRVSQGLGW